MATIEEALKSLVQTTIREIALPELRSLIRQEMTQVSRYQPDDLLGVEEAARLLGMTPAAVRKASQRGHLRTQRIGRTLRFRAGDLLNAEGE